MGPASLFGRPPQEMADLRVLYFVYHLYTTVARTIRYIHSFFRNITDLSVVHCHIRASMVISFVIDIHIPREGLRPNPEHLDIKIEFALNRVDDVVCLPESVPLPFVKLVFHIAMVLLDSLNDRL